MKKKVRGWTLVAIGAAVCLGSWGEISEARVFNFKNERVAAYFRGSGAMSRVGSDAFAKSSGSDAVFTDEVAYNFGGEIGALFHLTENANLRLGVELLQTKPLENIKGTDSSGTELFTVTSEVFVLNPIATIEINHYTSDTFRMYFYAGGGWADVTMDNTYVISDSNASGITDFKEKTGTTVASAHTGWGLETLFTDNVTFQFDVGYRYMQIGELKFKEGVTNISQGTVAKGDIVKNDDGSNRNFDMGGYFVGIGFRFYIDVPY